MRPLWNLALAALLVAYVHADIFTIGVLIPWSGWSIGPNSAGAIPVAIKAVNDDPNILVGHELKFVHRDTECLPSKGLGYLFGMMNEHNISGLIGDGCSVVCEPTSLVTTFYNIPQVSWGCTSLSLSDKSTYTNFVRTVGDWNQFDRAFTALLRHFQWEKVAIITTTQSVWQLTAQRVFNAITANGSDVVSFVSTDAGTGESSTGGRLSILQSLKERNAKIILLFAYDGDTRDILLTADSLGMASEGYAWITAETTYEAWKASAGWMPEDGRDEEARLIMQGLVTLSNYLPSGPVIDEFYASVRRELNETFGRPIGDDIEVNNHAMLMYDAVYMYAYALDYALKNNMDYRDGLALIHFMTNNTFNSKLTGTVRLNQRGDRLSDWTWYNFQGLNFVPVLNYGYERDVILKRPEEVEMLWPGNSRVVPEDSVPERLIRPARGAVYFIYVITALFAAFTVALMFIVKRHSHVKIIRAGSPRFLILFLVGCLVIYAYVILYSQDPTDSICRARPWVGHIGYYVVFAALFLKTHRIHKLFNRRNLSARSTLTDAKLTQAFLFMALLFAIYLFAWMYVDPTFVKVTRTELDDAVEVIVSCANETDMWAIGAIIIEGAFMIWGIYLCFQVRHVSDFFQESKYIAWCIWSISVVAIIVVPLYFGLPESQTTVLYVIQSFAVVFMTLFCTLFIFAPKLYRFYLDPDRRATIVSKRNTPSGAPHRGQPNNSQAVSSMAGHDHSSYATGPINSEADERVAALEKRVADLTAELELLRPKSVEMAVMPVGSRQARNIAFVPSPQASSNSDESSDNHSNPNPNPNHHNNSNDNVRGEGISANEVVVDCGVSE